MFSLAALGLFASPLPDETLKARGYSWVLQSSEGRFQVYHQAGDNCWLDAEGEDLVSSWSKAQPDGSGLVRFSASAEQSTVYIFDPIRELPPACLQPDRSDRAAVVAVADLMENHYPGFEARGLDFRRRRDEVLARLPLHPTSTEAFTASEQLLARLDDAHVGLSAEIRGQERSLAVSEGPTLDQIRARGEASTERAWLASWRLGIETTILDGNARFGANNRVAWGVRDNVGYLMVITMGGFDADDEEAVAPLDDALDQALFAFADVSAVVVDVSNNRGGFDSISLRIAGRFADRPRQAYLKRGWSSGLPAQRIEVRPSDRRRYLGPVWLLTSDITVSAGETFAQAMRVLPNVTHAGTATRGAFSDQTVVPLPNGWSFAMPMELYSDPGGIRLEGRGLEPIYEIDLYPANDLNHGHAKAVRALMGRLD